MNAAAIVIIAIVASGVLMMRFRKRWLAKINIAFTNRITGLFAGWLPGEEFLALCTLLPFALRSFKPCCALREGSVIQSPRTELRVMTTVILRAVIVKAP
jgi:hypothetical protein